MAADGGKDHFGDLTDDLLQHVLSFMPEDDALQTCVLVTRWRGLWRHTTSLRFNLDDWSSFPTCERFEQLVKFIIHLRGNSPLAKCEINVYPDESLYANTKLLLEYALNCQVEELLLEAGDIEDKPLVLNTPLISQHLKILHLEQVTLECYALNFSGCPVLEDLKMMQCGISAWSISSESLKHLSITDDCTTPLYFHIRISAPNLNLLQLEDFDGLTPFLESMPLLETAHVELGRSCHDFCNSQGNCQTHKCGCHDYPDGGVLLNGLSNAVNLELIAEPEMFIYRWDLAWGPTFGKLKTLVLNEWFTAVDLVCILQQSPILEMLTLMLSNTEVYSVCIYIDAILFKLLPLCSFDLTKYFVSYRNL
uniref:Uncharacterized protein n=1 Tax=Avena sativa TaxID=4498 RepID=A0ACD5YUZ7_AVESA